MKEIAYIILCCFSTEEGGMYRYEASRVDDSKRTGNLYSISKYQEGDTVTRDGGVRPFKSKKI
jgi:hypothetical protein